MINVSEGLELTYHHPAGMATNEENLVARILIYIGISIKQPELQSAGAGNIQLNKQEQNS